jgi:hypothetical protein
MLQKLLNTLRVHIELYIVVANSEKKSEVDWKS